MKICGCMDISISIVPVIGKKYENWLKLLKKLELQNSFVWVKKKWMKMLILLKGMG